MSDKPVGNIFPEEANISTHESVIEAMGATANSVTNAKRATQERKKWLYILTEETEDWVKTFFNRPQEAPARVGVSGSGKRIVAVWNVDGTAPDCEPSFD